MREEWEKHIGWHRKEDIGRLRKSNNQPAADPQIDAQQGSDKNIHNNDDEDQTIRRWWFSSILVFMLIIGIIFRRIFRHKCRKGSKRRKTRESTV